MTDKPRTRLGARDERNSVDSRVLYLLLAACITLLVADAWFPKDGEFKIEHAFGFYAFAGLIGCVVLGLIAWAVRGLLLRDEDYYDR